MFRTLLRKCCPDLSRKVLEIFLKESGNLGLLRDLRCYNLHFQNDLYICYWGQVGTLGRSVQHKHTFLHSCDLTISALCIGVAGKVKIVQGSFKSLLASTHFYSFAGSRQNLSKVKDSRAKAKDSGVLNVNLDGPLGNGVPQVQFFRIDLKTLTHLNLTHFYIQ